MSRQKIKTQKQMKTKLLLALCLAGCMAKAQNLVTNGDFESYNTLPTTCFSNTSASTISDVNNWSAGSAGNYYNGSNCMPGYNPCGGCVSVPNPATYYINNSTGGNGSCEIAPYSGNGYVILQGRGFNYQTGGNSAYEAIWQPISTTLYAGGTYLCTFYSTGGYDVTAVLSTGAAADLLIGSAASTVTGSSGWMKHTVNLTVPSNGTYNLIIGYNAGACFPGGYYSNFIDDVSLVETPCPANAGPNEINQQDNCGNWPGVQIGTPAVTNMTYAWSPGCHFNTGHLSSCTVAQPTSAWTNTTTPEVYTVYVSGPGCTTNTSNVTVTAASCVDCGGGCREAAQTTINGSLGALVHLSVYPNPSNNNITIGLYDVADYIRIIDMQGRTVFETQNTDAGELKLDISQYTKGIYFVMAKIGNTLQKQKLVVE